jgi:hypothetical protein
VYKAKYKQKYFIFALIIGENKTRNQTRHYYQSSLADWTKPEISGQQGDEQPDNTNIARGNNRLIHRKFCKLEE